MFYVEKLPGTIARITEHPTQHGFEDVNQLSLAVVDFNDWDRKTSGRENLSREDQFHLFFLDLQ
jgi:hypothetical protein